VDLGRISVEASSESAVFVVRPGDRIAGDSQRRCTGVDDTMESLVNAVSMECLSLIA